MQQSQNQLTPGGLVLLPILYLVWSETLIQSHENQAFLTFLNQADWLSEEDKNF